MMSKVEELAYDIEQLYIDGYSPKSIAAQLSCPINIVYDWLEQEGVLASDSDQGEQVFASMVKDLA
jgi:hypothetical protein